MSDVKVEKVVERNIICPWAYWGSEQQNNKKSKASKCPLYLDATVIHVVC